MSSSDNSEMVIAADQVSIAEFQSELLAMESKFDALMQQMLNHQLEMVGHLAGIRTACVSLEYRAMYSKLEDDELVRQLHNEWTRWNTQQDREYFIRQVEYQRYKWLLSRSREISASLKKELETVWRYLMSVFRMYVREDKDAIMEGIEKARDENKPISEEYWNSALATHEDKVSTYNQVLEAHGIFVAAIHAHEATAEGMSELYEKMLRTRQL